MKKHNLITIGVAVLVLSGMLLPKMTYGQIKKDTVSIVSWVDDMTGKEYLFPTHKIVMMEDDDKGFNIRVDIGNRFTLYTKMWGLGGCNEKDRIIILLQNSERIEITSWKKFNCEGESYFTLTSDDVEKMRSSPLSKIRMTNGRSNESLTLEVDESQKKYFIHLFNSYQNGNYPKVSK